VTPQSPIDDFLLALRGVERVTERCALAGSVSQPTLHTVRALLKFFYAYLSVLERTTNILSSSVRLLNLFSEVS